MISGNGIKGLNKLKGEAFVGLCMYDKVRSVEVNITYLTNDFDDNFIQIERYCEMDVSMMLVSFLSYQPLGVQLRKGTVMVIPACRLVYFYVL